jgi:hypothetical protein
MKDEGYSFTSDLFEVEQGEDEETNPGCFGKALAEWLAVKLSTFGYETHVIPEDWGWCVMCRTGAYLLWVGCCAMHDEDYYENYDPNAPPDGKDIEWYAFAHIEVPFFMLTSTLRKWFGHLDINTPHRKLAAELYSILSDEAGIELIPT